MALVLLRVCAMFYVMAAAAAAAHLFRPTQRGERRVLTGLLIALLTHALAVGGRTVEIGAFPMTGIHDALSLFGFLSASIAAAVALRGGVPQVVWLAGPLVAGLVGIAAIVEPSNVVPEALRSPFLGIHIGLALTGDAAFVIAGVVSIVYLVQERRLKRKRRPRSTGGASGRHRLPPLEVLDAVSVRLFKWGFPLMTLGLISGALYANQVWGKFWAWDPRNTVSLLVWIMYALMLHARLLIGWRGRRAAILTVIGVIAIVLAFVGLGLAGVGTHGKEYVS